MENGETVCQVNWKDELTRRMAMPQRHRLLQGFPMLPLMRAAVPGESRQGERRVDGSLAWGSGPAEGEPEGEPPWVTFDASRPLIVGVLPHNQCNPRVKGCGFCTFPHDEYRKPQLIRTIHSVIDEVGSFFEQHPELARRRVVGLYFGGATANLTPARYLTELGQALAGRLDLREAEVTLEGVPALFRSLFSGPFEALVGIPARHRRLSMGVQTFDQEQITRMGRQGFGDRRVVSQVVDKAHRHGMTISGDFVVNLPGQTRAQMLEDARLAAAIGLDQICVYQLVLTADMSTPWASDPALLAALPSTRKAGENWLAVRSWLLENGFEQTSLTNFERVEVRRSEQRFVYEECSFTPERHDALGFGPLSISTFVDLPRRRATKLVRGKSLQGDSSRDLYFAYEEPDLRLLHLTRTLARLRVDRATYRALFGDDLVAHFREPIEALIDAGLVTLDDAALRLTPRGMVHADSVAGLLAWPRVEQIRASGAGRHTRDVLDERMREYFMG